MVAKRMTDSVRFHALDHQGLLMVVKLLQKPEFTEDEIILRGIRHCVGIAFLGSFLWQRAVHALCVRGANARNPPFRILFVRLTSSATGIQGRVVHTVSLGGKKIHRKVTE